MSAFSMLKFWRTTTAEADLTSETNSSGYANDDVLNPSFDSDDELTDEEDSFFDLVIRSPQSRCNNVDDNKSCESPRDVFLTDKNYFTFDSNPKPLSPVSFLKSAPKFKVFTLGFRKSAKSDELSPKSPLNRFAKPSKNEESKRFDVKCRTEEIPVFTRETSLRSRMLKENVDENLFDFSMQKREFPRYLKLIKPLYVKVSKKKDERSTRLSESVTPSASPVSLPSPRKLSESNRIGSFKIVTKHLGKSRSSPAAVPVSPSPVRRRDDCLLDDGIQGAILHCKNSYNSSLKEISQLPRCASDPSHEKLIHPIPGSSLSEEKKRCSI